MTITAKFASRCTACHCVITPGSVIEWAKGRGARHQVCPTADNKPARVCALDATGFPLVDAPFTRPVVSLSALVAFLRAARERGLKFPKVRFAAPGKGELLISLAGDTSRNPGAVYVKLNGEYAGKVTAEGAAYGLDALLPTLQAIEADPARAAEFHGALTGRCSFCDKALTDDGSIEVGYGPVCARRYDLPHTAKGSAKVVPVVNVTPALGRLDAQLVGATYLDGSPFPAAQPRSDGPALAEARRILANVADDNGVIPGDVTGDYDGTLDYNEAYRAGKFDNDWRL